MTLDTMSIEELRVYGAELIIQHLDQDPAFLSQHRCLLDCLSDYLRDAERLVSNG